VALSAGNIEGVLSCCVCDVVVLAGGNAFYVRT